MLFRSSFFKINLYLFPIRLFKFKIVCRCFSCEMMNRFSSFVIFRIQQRRQMFVRFTLSMMTMIYFFHFLPILNLLPNYFMLSLILPNRYILYSLFNLFSLSIDPLFQPLSHFANGWLWKYTIMKYRFLFFSLNFLFMLSFIFLNLC